MIVRHQKETSWLIEHSVHLFSRYVFCWLSIVGVGIYIILKVSGSLGKSVSACVISNVTRLTVQWPPGTADIHREITRSGHRYSPHIYTTSRYLHTIYTSTSVCLTNESPELLITIYIITSTHISADPFFISWLGRVNNDGLQNGS